MNEKRLFVIVASMVGLVAWTVLVVSISISFYPDSWTNHCPPRPFHWTHDPDRFLDLGGCRFAAGKVLTVNDDQDGLDGSGHGDGDLRFLLQVDLPYSNLLNQKNRDLGGLQVEVVPAYRKHGVGAGINQGDHVEVVGSWVLDTAHGWQELHPATLIRRA